MKKILFLFLLLSVYFKVNAQIVFTSDTSSTRKALIPTDNYGLAYNPVMGLRALTKTGNTTLLSGITTINTKSGSNVTLTTADISEVTNLYFTQARARSSLSATGLISYNNSTGIIGLTTGTSTQYYRGDGSLQTLNTSAVTESTNLYYTDARARASKSALAPIVYNSGTGVISIPVATSLTDGYLSAANFTTFNNKQSPATTIAGYGITDADPYIPVASYSAMNALSFTANTAKRVLVQNDEKYGLTNQWYMVWADGGGIMRSHKLVVIVEK